MSNKKASEIKVEEYKKYIKDVEFLALKRNELLLSIHGSIPSYALWDGSSIEEESEEERIRWFITFFGKYPGSKYYSELSERTIGPCHKNN